MKPTRLQRFFAHKCVMLIFPLICAAVAVAPLTSHGSRAVTGGFKDIALLVVAMILLAFVAMLIGFVSNVTLLAPLWLIRSRINGAPFQVGDDVLILSGPFRDRIATVYDVWDERGEVRLDLGESHRRLITDVFSELKVCRVNQTR